MLIQLGIQRCKISLLTLTLFVTICGASNGQMQQLPFRDSIQTLSSPFIITAPDNTLLSFYYAGPSLYFSRSSNNGIDWSEPVIFTSANFSGFNYITGLVTHTGRILIFASVNSNYTGNYIKTFSDDNGLKWSPVQNIHFDNAVGANLSQSANGKIFFIYSTNNTSLFLSSSNNNGATFSSPVKILTGPGYGSIVPLNGTNLLLVYQNKGIYSSLSSNDGVTWGTPVSIDTNAASVFYPQIIKDNAGKIWLFYQQSIRTMFPGITQSDIVYRQSNDNGITWNPPVNLTKFLGYDGNFNLSIKGNYPLVSFTSDRGNSKLSLWYGYAGITEDRNTPPYLYNPGISDPNPKPGQELIISALVDGYISIKSVELIRDINGTVFSPNTMYDDGTHGDVSSGDKIYTCTVPGLNSGEILQTTINIIDQVLNSGSYKGPSAIVMLNNSLDSVLIDVNRFKLPVDNMGILADISIGEIGGGKYDGNITLFSGGFLLGGYSNSIPWANEVFSASRISDYVPGKVGSVAEDPRNILYVVRSTDAPFGQSWQNWKFAVSQGADFYDGNHDGIYNPVDLNGNGKWDLNEDRPDLLGDITAWCVYNDGIPAIQRTFNDVNPQGLEIQQSVFAQKDSADLNNVIFIRYRLINRGSIAEVMDSVYFGSVNDVDIGDSGQNDLDGCDTLLNSAYTYHKTGSGDGKFGINPPVETITMTQGPISYIPGITFTDVNSNGIYDPGTDIPLDTAFSFKGPLLGKAIYPGAKNLNITSANNFFKQGEPYTRIQAWYTLKGKYNLNGSLFNPCSGNYGIVLGGINCADVNPLFLFSGDPLTNSGWIDNAPHDQRDILCTGPFKLEKNKPVDILIANIVGRGSDALNSITVAKGYAKNIITYVNSNFPNSILTEVKELSGTVTDFRLYQNYPNPFNPTTRIKFSLKSSSLVSLKVYDILGKEVAVLMNEEKHPGEYEVNFNAGRNNLASGIYFYRLTAGSFTSIKKMVLIK